MNTHHHFLHRAQVKARAAIASTIQPTRGYTSPPSITIGQENTADNQDSHSLEEIRHLESKHKYPQLGLSAGEYVIQEAHRHPIGLFSIWAVAALVLLLSLVALPLYATNRDSLAQSLSLSPSTLPSAQIIAVPLFIASSLFVLGAFVASKVYLGNRFYLTNESIIQRVQASLFHVRQQTINLINVEDVSYDKRGILQVALNYGNIRLSTQGEETVYHFYTVSDPSQLAQAINDATESVMHAMEHADTPQAIQKQT